MHSMVLTGEEKAALAAKMREIAQSRVQFFRGNMEAQAIVLIGAKPARAGLNVRLLWL